MRATFTNSFSVSGAITVAKNRTPYGRYDLCSDAAGTYLRMGLVPTYLTADVVNGATHTGYDTIFSHLLRRARTDYSDIFTLDFSIIVDPIGISYGHMGGYWRGETSIYQAMRDVLRSINASFQCYAPSGTTITTLHLQRLSTPAGTPFAVDKTVYLRGSLRRIKPQDRERGIPPWRVLCNYARCHNVMKGADVAGATAADIAFVSREYRTATAENAAIQAVYPSSPEVVLDTDLNSAARAASHLTYFQGQHTSTKQMLALTVGLDDFLAHSASFTKGVILGHTPVRVTADRFGLSAGQDFSAVGYVLDVQKKTVDLILWG